MYLFFVFFMLAFVTLLGATEILASFLLILSLFYISVMGFMGDAQGKILAMSQSYECSFEYGMSGCSFSLQFYVVSFSFLLFDLEICLFTPLVMCLSMTPNSLYFSVFFLLLVFFAYLYEVFLSAFEW